MAAFYTHVHAWTAGGGRLVADAVVLAVSAAATEETKQPQISSPEIMRRLNKQI